MSTDIAVSYTHLQVTEIAPVTPKVIEYQPHQLRCPQCRRVTTASLPAEVARSRFGARLQSIVGLLRGRFRLCHRDIPEAMEGLFGVDMGLGTTTRIQRRLIAALDEPYKEAVLHIRGAPCGMLTRPVGRSNTRPVGCG